MATKRVHHFIADHQFSLAADALNATKRINVVIEVSNLGLDDRTLRLTEGLDKDFSALHDHSEEVLAALEAQWNDAFSKYGVKVSLTLAIANESEAASG